MIFDGLTITIGCPGSGKSTWADRTLPLETLRLERDRFREALFGSRQAYHTNPIDRGIRSRMITEAMLAAAKLWPVDSWAVTDTGISYAAIEPFIWQARVWDHDIRLIIFERDEGFLRTNNRIRPLEHRVPDELLTQMVDDFNDPEAWWRKVDYEKAYV